MFEPNYSPVHFCLILSAAFFWVGRNKSQSVLKPSLAMKILIHTMTPQLLLIHVAFQHG
jgi:hypothetical protein